MVNPMDLPSLAAPRIPPGDSSRVAGGRHCRWLVGGAGRGPGRNAAARAAHRREP